MSTNKGDEAKNSEKSSEFDVDKIIDKLLNVRSKRPGTLVELQENDVETLCQKSKSIFVEQPMFLELEPPIKIVGDIHGQYYDLLRLFEYGGYPPDANYLFLGDYVDRGKQSIESICLLLAYKIKYPENFFILRGNHECASINRIYGFYDECKRRYTPRLWKRFTDCFNCLPVAGIVADKIFCMYVLLYIFLCFFLIYLACSNVFVLLVCSSFFLLYVLIYRFHLSFLFSLSIWLVRLFYLFGRVCLYLQARWSITRTQEFRTNQKTCQTHRSTRHRYLIRIFVFFFSIFFYLKTFFDKSVFTFCVANLRFFFLSCLHFLYLVVLLFFKLCVDALQSLIIFCAFCVCKCLFWCSALIFWFVFFLFYVFFFFFFRVYTCSIFSVCCFVTFYVHALQTLFLLFFVHFVFCFVVFVYFLF